MARYSVRTVVADKNGCACAQIAERRGFLATLLVQSPKPPYPLFYQKRAWWRDPYEKERALDEEVRSIRAYLRKLLSKMRNHRNTPDLTQLYEALLKE